MRRVLVTGSRDWDDAPTMWNALNSELNYFPGGIIIVHGGARGADDLADRWASRSQMAGWPVWIERYPAEWDEHGKRAGNVRNQRMVDLGADVCHAFPLEGGTGTRHCMSRAMAAGIPVINHGFAPHTDQAREFADAYLSKQPKTQKAYL